MRFAISHRHNIKGYVPYDKSLAREIKSPLLLLGTTHVRIRNVLYYIIRG
jgi:hypothetical protein